MKLKLYVLFAFNVYSNANKRYSPINSLAELI